MYETRRNTSLTQIMNNVLFLMVAFFVAGCGTVECMDAKITRDVKPVDNVYVFEFQYKESEPIKKEIICEEYYDAMCAERGNYWEFREVGFEKNYQSSQLTVEDKQIGKIQLSFPLCSDLVKNRYSEQIILGVDIDGTPYFYQQSDGDIHTYAATKVYGEPVKKVSLKYKVKVSVISALARKRQLTN